jgi:TetR/AcrR family transcriptional repressor of nem operon
MTSETAEIAHMRMPGRPREFDMDDALDKAVQVFCERGFHATSIADLMAAMGLTSGSIYKAFKDKRTVFIAALDRQMAQRAAALHAALDAAASGRDKVRAALALYAGVSYGVKGRIGCLVVGTAVELATFDAEIAQRIVDAMHQREKLLADLLRLGQSDGSIPRGVAVKPTARFLLCLLQGLRVVGKMSPTRADMEAAVEVAMKAID